MKLDSNAAWKEAAAAIAANREVLLVLAGVFLFLPSLAFSLLFPQPEPQPGMTPQQMYALFGAFYSAAMPWIALMAALQATGTMAILTLFTDRSRPTVGEALREGTVGMLSYVASQLILGMAGGLVAIVILLIAGLTGSTALVAAATFAIVLGAIYVALRAILVAPVVAVERIRNPVTALIRSWNLTRGNAGRIFLFFFLIALAFGLVILIAMAVIGVILALVVGMEAARVVAAVVSSGMLAVLTLYLIAALAAVHRQLAGPSTGAISATFE